MNKPLVSICIPTYNRPQLLERAIRSCLSQTYRQFEVIITDNSDNFESRDVASRLNDDRIRYEKNEKNIGGTGNCSKALSLARGKYVRMLMDDDLLKPQALELMVAAFEANPTVGIVMAPMALIDEDDRRIFPYFYVFRKMHYRYRFQVGSGLVERRTLLKEYLVHDYPCCVPSGIMYSAQALADVGLFDLNAGFAIDLDLCMRIAARYDFYYIDQVLSSWRYMKACETAASYQKGFDITKFYYVTRKTLADRKVMDLFPQATHNRLVRDSIFFCSCRALLNGLAGLRGRNFKLITNTIRTIFREDPYLWNKLRLPWFILREILVSFVPQGKPLPRE